MGAQAKRYWIAWGLLLASIGSVLGLAGLARRRTWGVGGLSIVLLDLSLLGLLGLFFLPAFPALRQWLCKRWSRWARAWLAWGGIHISYGSYLIATGDCRWTAAGKLEALVAMVFWFAMWPPSSSRVLLWQDAVAMAWLALPAVVGWTNGIWAQPVELAFMARATLAATGTWAFLVVRQVDADGFRAGCDRQCVTEGLRQFGLFALVGIPLGLGLGFIGWNPHWPGLPQALLAALFTLIFIALPEELLFRGLLQNLAQSRLGSYGAQAVASVLFGLSHIVHEPFPNWDYVLLASIAGWFYGNAWRQTGSVMAAAVTHTLVDWTWGLFWHV